MYPKDFINDVLINEFSKIVKNHPYLAFSLIATGIEFLGKCQLTSKYDWHEGYAPGEAFNEGLALLTEIDDRYNSVGLRQELRNGFAHTLLPKYNLALSEVRHGQEHFGVTDDGKPILVIEILFRDFVMACKKVNSTPFAEGDKMHRTILRIV